MTAPLETIPKCDLGFVELNPDQPSTILFLHGAFSIPLETSLVTPHLQQYHILVPAIHINVKALDPRPPFSIPYVCEQVAALLQSKAKNGQAHVYGHSMGAHLALNLAMLYPDRVTTVIASGLTLTSHWPSWKRAAVPSFLWAQFVLPRMLPTKMQVQLFNLAMRPASDTIATEFASQPVECSWELCKEICASADPSMPPDKPVNIRARALIVAGTGTPSDPVRDVRWVVAQIRKAQGEARGVEIKQGGHPWILQLPELCADLIKAWIEGTDLPAGASSIA